MICHICQNHRPVFACSYYLKFKINILKLLVRSTRLELMLRESKSRVLTNYTKTQYISWAQRVMIPQPSDYESAALTS